MVGVEQFMAYYASKACLYLLFIHRIKTTFAGSEYQCSKSFILVFEIVVVLSETCLCAVFMLFESFQFCATRDDSLHLCSAHTELTENVSQNIGGFAVELIAVLDLIFSGLTLFIFVHKLRRLALNSLSVSDRYVALQGAEPSRSSTPISLYSAKAERIRIDSDAMARVTRLMGVTLKCCVLASAAILANWIFLFAAEGWLFDLSWFICVDCLVNALCIYFMFRFSEAQYKRVCCPLIRMWNMLGICCGITRFTLKQMDQEELELATSDAQEM